MENGGIYRCGWCLGCKSGEKMIRYHDEEWGIPLHDDIKQFEFLMLEVMQCGLNWDMMITKREIFRKCFSDFDYNAIAGYGEEDIERILSEEGMIRSRRKIEAIIGNACRFREIIAVFGSFEKYLHSFSGDKVILYQGHQKGYVPARNGLSDRISADLKKRGFKYLGSVTVYSHLQACGIVNDHSAECFRYKYICENYPTAVKRRDNES